jgi:hypothetical protein
VELKRAARSWRITAFSNSQAFHKDRLLQISFLATTALLIADSAFPQYGTPCTAYGRRLCDARNATVAEPCPSRHMANSRRPAKPVWQKKVWQSPNGWTRPAACIDMALTIR